MMYPFLHDGDGREKKMNRGLNFGQLFQRHQNRARNSSNAAAKDLVDLYPNVVKLRCFVLNCVSAQGHASRNKGLLLE